MIQIPKQKIKDFVKKLLPNRNDTTETVFFKIIVYVSLCLVLFMFLMALTTFFITIRGPETAIMPNVKGMELVKGLIELQEKGLLYHVQERTSRNKNDRGIILDQSPSSGTQIKAGSIVIVIISKGVMSEKIESFIGKKIDSVKALIQDRINKGDMLLSIKLPVVYIFDNAESGTILQQKPLPNSAVYGNAELEFIVSRGKADAEPLVGNYLQQSYTTAIEELTALGIPFSVKYKKADANEKKGIIIEQNPLSGSNLPKKKFLLLTITAPTLAKNQRFGIFETELPQLPLLSTIRLECETKNGGKRILFTQKNYGGNFGLPYIVDNEDKQLLLFVEGDLKKKQVFESDNP